MKTMSRIPLFLFATITVLLGASSNAQWVDANGNPVINPNSGERLIPCLNYDPSTGLLSLWNYGANEEVDSNDNSTLLGDDVGMISLLLTYNGDSSGIDSVLPLFGDGIAWSAPTVFNGKIQLSGNAIAASFLPISDSLVPVALLPAGLTLADFVNPNSSNVEAEMGVNFNFNAPGNTLFNDDFESIFCIPEPHALALGLPFLPLLTWLRRRSHLVDRL